MGNMISVFLFIFFWGIIINSGLLLIGLTISSQKTSINTKKYTIHSFGLTFIVSGIYLTLFLNVDVRIIVSILGISCFIISLIVVNTLAYNKSKLEE